MATTSANSAKSFTTSAGTADTCTLTWYGKSIQVVHRDPTDTDPIWFTLGPTAADTTTPTAEGDNCYVALPGVPTTVPWPPTAIKQVVVKTICASAQPCTIQVFAERAF